MIYVIAETRLVSGITVEDIKVGKCESELCIKIGFTTCFENRMSQYATDTPRFDILYTYEEGTSEDERNLHKYFDKYRHEDLNGREWFSWNEEIIRFFETNTTIDLIRGHIIKERNMDDLPSEILSLINLIIDRRLLFSAEGDENTAGEVLRRERLIKTLPLNSVDECLDWLHTKLETSEYDLLMNEYEEIKKILDKFNSFSLYEYKLKYVCDVHSELSEERFILFLNSIPRSFKEYYMVLGPSRCKATQYRGDRLRKELDTVLHNQEKADDLKSLIYSTFKVGQRYFKADIKQKLQEIYTKLDYQKTPKANDLEEFFLIKDTVILNPTSKKKEHGFLIVSVK